MSELGQLLRAAREAKGLSYREVAKTTKIREHILIALEDETYDMLPAPVYVRGLLRTLARHLSLDAEALLCLYEKAVPQAKGVSPVETPSKPRLPVVARPMPAQTTSESEATSSSSHISKPQWTLPASLRAERSSTPLAQQAPAPPEPISDSRALVPYPNAQKMKPIIKQRAKQPSFKAPVKLNWRMVGIAAAAMVTLGLCGAYWGNFMQGSFGAAAAPTSATPTTHFSVMATATARAPAASPATPAPTDTPLPTPTPDPPTPTSNTAALSIKLDIVERTWLRIEVDGNDAFEGILNNGDTKTFTARKSVTMRAGNAGGVKVSVNGQAPTTLGGSGDVVDKQWSVNAQGTFALTTPTWVKPPFTPTPTITPQP